MKGEVVTILFPFSDLSTSKARPALIVIDLPGEDVVVAQITSSAGDPNAIGLEAKDFQTGGLNHSSFIRPAKLSAIERRLMAGLLENWLNPNVLKSSPSKPDNGGRLQMHKESTKKSGWADLNRRPLAPQASTLNQLRYSPILCVEIYHWLKARVKVARTSKGGMNTRFDGSDDK
jgi:mRNA interferase MazF